MLAFALLSVELHWVPVHSFLHPVETPLNDDTQSPDVLISPPNIICRLADGVFCPINQVINKAVK